MTLKPKKLRVAHAYELVSAELEAQILDGTLRPGDQLPGEIDLAETFGVNRSTIREGIRLLESEGLVRRPSPRKLVVSLPRAKDLTSRHTRALRMLDVSFLELWHVALAIEPLSAELAARFAGPEALAALDDTQARLEQATEAGKSQVAIDTEFHDKVATAGNNRALQLAREPIGFLLYSGMEVLAPRLPQAADRQIVAHQAIIAAIRARDPDTARTWMRRHIEDFKRGFELAGLPLDAPISACRTPAEA